jgi:hypothetical protein
MVNLLERAIKTLDSHMIKTISVVANLHFRTMRSIEADITERIQLYEELNRNEACITAYDTEALGHLTPISTGYLSL